MNKFIAKPINTERFASFHPPRTSSPSPLRIQQDLEWGTPFEEISKGNYHHEVVYADFPDSDNETSNRLHSFKNPIKRVIATVEEPVFEFDNDVIKTQTTKKRRVLVIIEDDDAMCSTDSHQSETSPLQFPMEEDSIIVHA